MSLWTGLEYAGDHVTLQCAKVCTPVEQKKEKKVQKKKTMLKESSMHWGFEVFTFQQH